MHFWHRVVGSIVVALFVYAAVKAGLNLLEFRHERTLEPECARRLAIVRSHTTAGRLTTARDLLRAAKPVCRTMRSNQAYAEEVALLGRKEKGGWKWGPL